MKKVERDKKWILGMHKVIEIKVTVRDSTAEEQVEFAHEKAENICKEIEPIIRYALETI